MNGGGEERRPQYVLSERRFSGSDAEVLRQLDELIEGLLAFRSWLAHDAQPARPARIPLWRRWRLRLTAGNKAGAW